MSHARWPSPPADLRLATGVVDVWAAVLTAAGPRDRVLLSADELARAVRFARGEDGERWAAARGVLRAVLARTAGVDPRELRFADGPHGKPAVVASAAGAADPRPLADAAGAPALSRVRFNLSHAGDLALIAVTLDREVGVDVELPRRRALDTVAIARRTFGAAEAERLAALDAAERATAFLRAWTRWEAVLKCRGVGIGGADEPADEPDPWVHDLDVGPPAAAALAVAGGPCDVRTWRWAPAGG